MSVSNSSPRSIAEDVFRELVAVLRDVKDPQKVFADIEGRKANAAALEKRANELAAQASDAAAASATALADAEKVKAEAAALRAGLQAKHAVLDKTVKDADAERIRLKTELAQKIADAEAARRAADEARKIADARSADAERVKAEYAEKNADLDKRLAKFKELAA